MARSNPLESAWRAYLVTKDCFRVARRAAVRGIPALFSGSKLLSKDIDHAQPLLEEGHARADEFVIVAMWAEFERFIIDYLGRRTASIGSRAPRALSQALVSHLEDRLEYSRIEDLLDLLKGTVDSQKLGQAKEVKKVRDWIAHRNPKKATPRKTDPRTTYALLSEIIEALPRKRRAG